MDEVYAMLKQYEKNGEKSGDVSVMASLRAIKISASPELSRRASLYELDKHDADQVATSLLVVPNPILEW